MLKDTETFRLVSNRSDFLTLGKELLQEIYTLLLIKTGGFHATAGMSDAELLLMRNYARRSPLQVASRTLGMSVCVQYLLDCGAE